MSTLPKDSESFRCRFPGYCNCCPKNRAAYNELQNEIALLLQQLAAELKWRKDNSND